MNLLIIENNFLFNENFFFKPDLKDNINITFSSSIRTIKSIIKKKKFDFIIICSLGSNLNSFNVIRSIFKEKPAYKIIQILDKNNDLKHDFSSFFLVKPFLINKLLLILSKSKRKNSIRKKKFISLKNGLIFKKSQRKLSNIKRNKEITLTEKECDILNYLIKEKRFIKKIDLLESIWGFNKKVKTRTLETHIYRLRKKLIEIFDDDKFIISTKEGYKIQ